MLRRVLIPLCLLIAWTMTSVSAQDDDVITIAKAEALKTVTSVALSPDGEWIAATRIVPRTASETNGGAHSELVVSRFGQSGERVFVAAPGRVASVSWTPDSRRIVFTSRRGADKFTKLYAMPLDGGAPTVLVEGKSSISSYDISADGKWVVYTATKPESRESKAAKTKGFDQIIYEENWRPVEIHLVNLESGETKTLPVSGTPWTPKFSPDGKRLALWMTPTPLVDDSYMLKKLYVYELATGRYWQAARNPGKVGNFDWSPDSEQIAFVSALDKNDPRESKLVVVPATGGPLSMLTPVDFEGHVLNCSWLDNEMIGFLAAEACDVTLNLQPARGGMRTVLLREGLGVWTAFSECQAGDCFALVGNAPEHPGEVFSWEIGEDEPTRITDSNPSLEQTRLADQRVVSYKARDGLRIDALLILPLDYVKGRRYPLIVQVHGGPESNYSNGWTTRYSTPGQVAAAQGFAVLYPNYRGSTGRGVAFSKLDQTKLAEAEFDDLVDGVDYLVAEGIVDKNRVGVTGGSYGGYASAWCATKLSDRFAAAVMFVGISDQVSKIHTTDIPQEAFLVHWLIRPYGNWDKFLEASPIYHVPNAKTPILIAHGKDDPRVSYTQSLELYRALKTKGDVPVRLVLYPGEGHGNRKRAARLDYGLRLLRWFRHFLQDGAKKAPAKNISYEGL